MEFLELGKHTHNLQFHRLALKFDRSNLEVHSDCADIALRVGIVREPEQQA